MNACEKDFIGGRGRPSNVIETDVHGRGEWKLFCGLGYQELGSGKWKMKESAEVGTELQLVRARERLEEGETRTRKSRKSEEEENLKEEK